MHIFPMIFAKYKVFVNLFDRIKTYSLDVEKDAPWFGEIRIGEVSSNPIFTNLCLL